MSAYSDGRSTPIVSLGRGASQYDSDLGEIGNLSDKFENFISIIKNLENNLAQERTRSRKLRDDWSRAHEISEQTVRELEARLREYTFQEGRLKGRIKEQELTENDYKSKLSNIELEFEKAKEELQQFKTSWGEVLQREREAKMILLEGEQVKKALSDMEARCKKIEDELSTERGLRAQMERHAKSYQMELQNTLVRLHSSEAKYSELHKQLQAMQASRKGLDEEVAAVEAKLKEKFHWETAKEMEHQKAILERENVIEREKYREELRLKFESIHHHEIQAERARLEQARNQYEIERATLLKELEDARRGYSEKLIETQGIADRIRQDSLEKVNKAHEQTDAVRAEFTSRLEHSENRLKEAHTQVEMIRTDLGNQLMEAHRQLSELETEAKQAKALVQIERDMAKSRIESFESEVQKLGQSLEASEKKAQTVLLEGQEARRQLGRVLKSVRSKLSSRRERLKSATLHFQKEAAKWEGLEHFVLEEKSRFHRAMIDAEAELRKIKISHPLRVVLETKQRQIETNLDPVQLELLMQEYLEIKKELEQSENSIDNQIASLRKEREANTIIAEPV